MSPPMMDSSIVNGILFCSISRGNHILYSHGYDREIETLAAAALESAPPFHSRYSHTAGGRTFAFLIEDDGHTFFVITNSLSGSSAAHRFLDLMRESFRRASKNGVHDELITVVRGLIASLEKARGDGDELWIDVPVRASGSLALQRSSSSAAWMQQNGRQLWRRHVKIVVAVDLIVCFVLFGIWLAVCRGFQCVD